MSDSNKVFGTEFDKEGGRIQLVTKHGWHVDVILLGTMHDTVVGMSEEVCEDLGIPFDQVDWPLIEDKG